MKQNEQPLEKLFLVDAYALIFKFYYALISRPMRNKEGLNTSAIFGFTRFINDIIHRERPQYLGVAFDPPGGNFRSELYADYKANRSATPEDIKLSVPHIKRILEAMAIPILEIPGYEADDVIGTITAKGACKGFEIFMVTPDKDYGQLIRECVYMYKPSRSGEGIDIVGVDKICEHYGISDPKQIIDILALWGDASDNVPGVPGIGEKTATKLVAEYGNVENIIANADKLPVRQRDNILNNREQLLLSKRLVTIDLDVPIDFEPRQYHVDSPDYEELRRIYIEMGFNSFLKDLDYWHQNDRTSTRGEVPAVRETAPGQTPLQGDLFGETLPPQKSKQPAPPAVFSNASVGQPDLFGQPSGYAALDQVPHEYTTVSDRAALDQLVGLLLMQKEFAFSIETDHPEPMLAHPVGISFCAAPHRAYYLPLQGGDADWMTDALEKLRPVFASDTLGKIGANLKASLIVLANAGIGMGGRLYDTALAHYLLESESRNTVEYLARRYLNYSMIPQEDVVGKGVRKLTMDRVEQQAASCYSCEYTDAVFQLKAVLWKELQQLPDVMKVYDQIEEPLLRVLARMERTGVKIDERALGEYAVELNAQMHELEEKVRQATGEPRLNVNSSKQLGEILFGKMKLDDKPKLTPTKQYRTDEDYLMSLSHKHEVINDILEYRKLKKLLSTYVESFPTLINPRTGRLHTSFNQTVSATGRLSSNNPNLQNIPIRQERGREIRKAFIPGRPGDLILSVDYSQMELRIMANLSQDPALVEAFSVGDDVHAVTAARIFDVPLSEVTAEQRRQAKTANFGIMYGISAFGLAQRLSIPRADAKNLIDTYFATYPGVRDYIERNIEKAREEGYVATLFGRRRLLPDIKSKNANVRSYAERNAINAPIQGSGADIIKIAMNRIDAAISEQGLDARLILQVHDELVLEVHPAQVGQVKDMVIGIMEDVLQMNVKLTAEGGTGKNWFEAH